MPTFPPPRVDITSKTWPSFADMLLRRWREGGTFGESGFFFFLSAPRVSRIGGSGRGHRRVLASSAGLSAPTHQPRRSSATFRTPALFIDFDLRDSGVGVPPRRLLPSETAAPAAYADAALEQ